MRRNHLNISGVDVLDNCVAINNCRLKEHDPISLTSMVLLLLKETEYVGSILLMGDSAGLDMWLFLKQCFDREMKDRSMKKIGDIKQYIKLLGLDMEYSLKNNPVRYGLKIQEPYFYFRFYIAKEEGLLSE